MNYLYWTLAVLLISIISIIWIFAIWYPMAKLKKILVCFIAFSVGILLWDAFLHLIPESVEEYWFTSMVSRWIIWWICIGFIIEKILIVKHNEQKDDNIKTFARMNLVWDMVHNSIDWIIIWSAFIVDVHIWLATTLAVILHEIPQEIWDFCVLVHWWIDRKKALLYNFLTALTAFIWLWIAYLLNTYIDWISQILMPLSAWLFIYIAASDMIPELHKETHREHSLHKIIFLLIWFAVMYWLTLTEWDGHHHEHNHEHEDIHIESIINEEHEHNENIIHEGFN